MDLSIILVNYNARDLLRSCLQSMYRETQDIHFEVIVVDNASSDASVAMVAKEFPTVRLIRNASNRGFAAANNQGIVNAAGDVLLLLNTDTEVVDGAFQKVLRFMREHPDAAIVGCKLVYPDTRFQRSVGMFPSILEGVFGSTFLHVLLPRGAMVGRRRIIRFDFDADGEVDWVTGAVMFVRREVIEKIGLFDEQFFVYSEEVDFCRRARQAGFHVWYTPAATVIHLWKGMSSASRRSLLWILVSQILYFKKHHHGAEQTALVLLKYAGLIIRVPVYFFAGLFMFNKRMLQRSADSIYVFVRLLTTSIEYRRDDAAEVVPWTEIW